LIDWITAKIKIAFLELLSSKELKEQILDWSLREELHTTFTIILEIFCPRLDGLISKNCLKHKFKKRFYHRQKALLILALSTQTVGYFET
jgi:hypothetical protein